MIGPANHFGLLVAKASFIVCSMAFLFLSYAPSVYAMTAADQYSLEQNTPFYNPNMCGTPSADGGTTVNINNNAAQVVAQNASTGTVKVGYALSNASGTIQASYNVYENYGASITKAMLLIAYLNQISPANPSNAVQGLLTGMIEDSNDEDANNIFNLLSNPAQELTTVAANAGMTGFKLNTTGDSLYFLGQSQISASDFAKLFAKIDTLLPAASKTFALTLLSNIGRNAGLLNAGLPGTVYSKEGWKQEPGGAATNDPPISGSANPFGIEGAPWVVNQAAQFAGNGTTYGVAVTVSGVSDAAAGEAIIENVVQALVQTTSAAAAAPASGTGTNSQTCFCGSGTTSLNGSDNEQQVWNYLKSIGLTDAQAAGVMGNFEQESSFDPERLQGGGDSQNPSDAGSGGYGLAQWTPGAKILTDLSTNNINGPAYKLLTQLELVSAQMHGSSPKGTPDIISNWPAAAKTSATASAAYFDSSFEGGTDPGGVRESNAQAILAKYGGTGGGASSNSSSCTGGGGSGSCGNATGDAKIYCEALQYKPVSYSESIAGNHYPLPGGNLTWLKTCPIINASCYLDCSGLVNISVYDAFNYNEDNNTYGEAADTGHWQHIQFSQVHQGDLIQPNPGHVEIINDVQGTTINTFGAHDPQDGIGPAVYTASPGYVYLHWIGPTN